MVRRLPFAVAVLLSLFSFFTPAPDLPDLTLNVWDKAGHAALFALLAITGVVAAIRWRGLAAGLFGYAVVTEVLQATLPIHRSGDWHDVVADTVGIVIGTVIAWSGGRVMVGRRPPGPPRR